MENNTIKKRGRPKGSGILTEEEKKEKIRLFNAKRGSRPIYHKLCELCNKEYNTNNFSRHCKSIKHIKNSDKMNGNIELNK